MSEPAGVAVSQQQVPDVERRRMSYDEWWALPEKPKAEWVDGEVVIVNVPPAPDHQDGVFRLYSILNGAFPDHKVYSDVGVKLPHNRVRRPDIMLVPRRPEGYLVEDIPLLVVEILSRSTHAIDYFEKPTEYADAGISHLWIVDADARTFDAYDLAAGHWQLMEQFDRVRPSGEVRVAGRTLAIDLDEILAG